MVLQHTTAVRLSRAGGGAELILLAKQKQQNDWRLSRDYNATIYAYIYTYTRFNAAFLSYNNTIMRASSSDVHMVELWIDRSWL